jgi:enoyl-CoA hydratase/carnithine racemase
MTYEGYKCLRVRLDRGVAFATIDSPPINLLTVEMVQELVRLAAEVEADERVKVIVFDSANPDYFIAHFDVSVLLQFPDVPAPRPTEIHALDQVHEAFRTMPKVSIGQAAGRARGGGSEFLLGLDMRFGALGKTIFNQVEVGLGILPGGGGTQRLPRLIGQARALEVILGCMDIPAEVAERYGYLNRALPPEELAPFVQGLAYRIASFPAESIALAKKAVLAAAELPLIEGLLEESFLFNQSCALPAAKRRMQTFMDRGGQTYEVELDWDRLLGELAPEG